MKNLSIAVLVFSIASLTACQSNDLGTGANTVDREYAKPAPEACKAVLQSVESADFKVVSDKHDQLGGELVASRADGKEVRIFVKSLGEKSSRVSVRLEPGDRDLAHLMHERIAGNLGMGVATTGWWSGGESLETTYPLDLAACMSSGRHAVATLARSPTDEETHATWGRIDGRQKDSTPLRIKMEKIEDKKTRVVFIVGNAKSEDNKAFARKLKEEFEMPSRPAAGSP